MTKPFIPMAPGQPAETFLTDEGLKTDTRGLLQAAKAKIESDTAATVLEKVVGGSGKTKNSSDLTGIASLIEATQGGANQTMNNALGLLMGLLNRQDGQNGHTQSGMDDLLKFVLVMKILREDEPKQNNQMEAMLAHVAKIMEMQGLRFTDYIEMTKKHNDWVINDLRERSGPDPLTAQLYSQWVPTLVSQSIGQVNKDPVDHLLESADKLQKLKGISGLFGDGGGTLAEKLQMKSLDIQDRDMILSHQREMTKLKNKREAPQQWGNLLKDVFGGNAPAGGGMSLGTMMQGLSGLAGQPGQPPPGYVEGMSPWGPAGPPQQGAM